MSTLYIANATKQIQQFCYRHPVTNKAMVIKINVGGQERIPGVEEAPAIDLIIQKAEPYGLVSVAAVDRMREPFSGLCYSIDRPIDEDKLRRAMHKRIQGLDKLGEEIRKEAAIATNNEIEGNFGHNPEAPSSLSGFEMSVVEQEPKGGYSNDHKPFGETVRVTRDDAGAPRPSARLGRSKGKR